ncbi:isocitrate lyase/phosphoenolpyruvate mutase family protein [Actinomadura fulvescens]|uniref:Isocitrate lyase/phosphoenolpyruvate mutase family protein n=1 Tax=Actinomadura fulvescens TaxID=46160 RepID=A0ABP6BWB6_9ACTN
MTSTFHALHHGDKPLLLPNAWDFASGALLAEAGFPAIGTTSLGVAGVAGKPDASGDTKEETIALARTLARLPVPVTVDLEGGYSERPDEVGALVGELASFGIAGVNLEDGLADGTVRPVGHLVAVIEAVKAAAPEVFLNARTDLFWLGKGSRDETLERTNAYADAGADGVFVPGVSADDDVRALVQGTPLPLNVLHLPGRTDFTRMGELGARRVSCGSLLYRAALRTALNTALDIAGEPADRPIPSYADVQKVLTTPVTRSPDPQAT